MTRAEYHRTIGLLLQKGFLEVVDDEYGQQFLLAGSTPSAIGWDIFATLKEIAGDDRTLIERALVDLDLSVFDT